MSRSLGCIAIGYFQHAFLLSRLSSVLAVYRRSSLCLRHSSPLSYCCTICSSIRSPPICVFCLLFVLRRTNHTKWFWRDRSRAFSEKTAISLVVPVLEDAYAVGGELKPVGLGFRQSCLSDEPGKNGTTSSRSYRRAAIKVRGISRLPVTFERSLTMILCTVRQSSKET